MGRVRHARIHRRREARGTAHGLERVWGTAQRPERVGGTGEGLDRVGWTGERLEEVAGLGDAGATAGGFGQEGVEGGGEGAGETWGERGLVEDGGSGESLPSPVNGVLPSTARCGGWPGRCRSGGRGRRR
jgi:hypothetical protein